MNLSDTELLVLLTGAITALWFALRKVAQKLYNAGMKHVEERIAFLEKQHDACIEEKDLLIKKLEYKSQRLNVAIANLDPDINERTKDEILTPFVE